MVIGSPPLPAARPGRAEPASARRRRPQNLINRQYDLGQRSHRVGEAGVSQLVRDVIDARLPDEKLVLDAVRINAGNPMSFGTPSPPDLVLRLLS
jgi:hypothetical protein